MPSSRHGPSATDQWHKLVRSINFIGASDWTSLECVAPETASLVPFRENIMATRTDPAIWSGLFRISAESGQTLQAQIRQAIVAAILDRQIAASMPLPSCRILAEKLGVARGTVVLAFQQLVDQGFLIARERRGHFVNPDILAQPAGMRDTGAREAKEAIDWKARRRILA